MQIDKFDLWKFTNQSNCWDFVRQYLLERSSIPPEDMPKLGILHTDHEAKTAEKEVISCSFVQIDKPCDLAIACSHAGNLLTHVGVCEGDFIRHATYRGAIREPISRFESKGKTTYYLHGSLCK